MTVVCDAKFLPVNEAMEAWPQLPCKIIKARYQQHLSAYGRKVDRFNGKWSNNPAKLAALLAVARAEHPVWIFEDDVYCKDWSAFLQAYHSSNADLIASTAPVDKYPWFNRGWLVGDAEHVTFGVAGLYAFRISPAAARQVIAQLEQSEGTSHHEVFVPWAVGTAGMSIAPLRSEHARTMQHNASLSTNVCRCASECTDGVIFHPVKARVSGAGRRLARSR